MENEPLTITISTHGYTHFNTTPCEQNASKHIPTSNSNLELPKLVLCFCQKLSGLMMRAMWMQQGNDSCRIFSRGLMESHLEPRMSTMTVKPCLHTSSLGNEREQNMSFLIFFALCNLWCIPPSWTTPLETNTTALDQCNCTHAATQWRKMITVKKINANVTMWRTHRTNKRQNIELTHKAQLQNKEHHQVRMRLSKNWISSSKHQITADCTEIHNLSQAVVFQTSDKFRQSTPNDTPGRTSCASLRRRTHSLSDCDTVFHSLSLPPSLAHPPTFPAHHL